MTRGDQTIMFDEITQWEADRERRFFASLSNKECVFVKESEALRARLLREVQCMLTEKDYITRMIASDWVSRNAIHVAELNARVIRLRTQFEDLDSPPIKIGATSQ